MSESSVTAHRKLFESYKKEESETNQKSLEIYGKDAAAEKRRKETKIYHATKPPGSYCPVKDKMLD
jgi:hypothetical protein